MAAPIVKWRRVSNTGGPCPRPRHGHRAVAIKDLMVVFGGGNEGIVDELHVYNTGQGNWFVPPVKGDVPPGCAAYGFVVDGTRVLVFGGMVEYGKYSNELYELQASRWEWKRLKPKPPKTGSPPCPRLGHSFTLIGHKAFLFGGLANDSEDPKNNIPRYLNDLYTLEMKPNSSQMSWDCPQCYGQPPPPRESHTGVAYYDKDGKRPRLVIYGGMSGCRLGDLWQLDVDSMTWNKPVVHGTPPLPRSLHSATLIGTRMFIFGGWVPLVMDDVKVATHEKEWKCTNSLACLNLESMEWQSLTAEGSEDAVPRARAGHCAVAIHTRLYIWSGRDGYRKAWNNQVCCKDLWFLESEKPGAPSRVQLVRASTNSLEVCWGQVLSSDGFILQLQKYEMVAPVIAPAPTAAIAATTGVSTPSATTAAVVTPVPTTPSAPSPLKPLQQSLITRTPGPTQIRLPVRAGMPTVANATPTGVRSTVNVVRAKGAVGTQQLKTISIASPVQAIKTGVTVPSTSITGIAALAEAAVATQKVSSPAGIKVVTPTVVSAQGIKVTPVSGTATPGTQTIRVSAPATILKSAAGLAGLGKQQIITLQKGPRTPGQPQIVTLVKTPQGVTVATGKGLPPGATIVKLVTTQGGLGKPGTAILTTQAGGASPTVIGLPSVSGAQTKVLSTLLKTLPTTVVTGAKSSITSSSTSSVLPKQTIVIAAPKGGQTGGLPAKLLTTLPKLGSTPTTQIIVVTTSGTKPITTSVTTEAGKAKTSTVNVVPIPIGSTLNTVNTPTGVKMIVVSSGVGSGSQTFHIITTTATAGSQTATTSSPITITMPVSALSGGKSTTLNLPLKQLSGTQLVTIPASGLLSSTQTVTVGNKPVTVTVTTAQGQQKTMTIMPQQSLASAIATATTQAGVSLAQSQSVTTTTTTSTLPKVVVVTAPSTSAQSSLAAQSTTTVDSTSTSGPQTSTGSDVSSETLAAGITSPDLNVVQLDPLPFSLQSSVEADSQLTDSTQTGDLSLLNMADPLGQLSGDDALGLPQIPLNVNLEGIAPGGGDVPLAEGNPGEAASGIGLEAVPDDANAGNPNNPGEALEPSNPENPANPHNPELKPDTATSSEEPKIDQSAKGEDEMMEQDPLEAQLARIHSSNDEPESHASNISQLNESLLQSAIDAAAIEGTPETVSMPPVIPNVSVPENLLAAAMLQAAVPGASEDHLEDIKDPSLTGADIGSAGIQPLLESGDSSGLATLATAAITTASSLRDTKPVVAGSANGVGQKDHPTELSKTTVKKENQWYDVGVIKQTSTIVSHYCLPSDSTNGERNDDEVDLLAFDFNSLKKQELSPGTAYKFRVAAINACGRGPWSEVSAFKTCLPGYPGAPSAIKISKGTDGAHLTWEAPQNTSGRITEYSVYLAVRSATTPSQTVTSSPSQLAFVRVYCGPSPTCTVNNTTLSTAHIDYSTKAAIIFRIAAKNEKGYGPATQVRWLQDNATPAAGRPATTTASTPVKRQADTKPTAPVAKKVKAEEGS
ncbi:Host cell factor 1 [Chamberlinius hualienensis]